jgi:HK97 family phage prohead protease
MNMDIHIETRLLAGLQPDSFNEQERTCTALLSKGSPVTRLYGIERLEISKRAVDLSRVAANAVPVLDSHQVNSLDHLLGRTTFAWIENGALFGRLQFAETEKGLKVAAMIQRGEVSAVSIGYRTMDFEITDRNGDVVDPRSSRWNEDDLTFTATRWQLVETSIVSTPADVEAAIRNIDNALPKSIFARTDTIARMKARARMHTRWQSHLAASATRARMAARQAMVGR